MISKIEVHTFGLNFLAEKIAALKNKLTQLTEDAKSDAKSSAGDKHETAISMMQIEQENINKQIAETQGLLNTFQRILPNNIHSTINIGSLVHTDKGYFYVSASIGKHEVGNDFVFYISAVSPLGMALIGQKTKKEIIVNQNIYTILSVI